MKKRITSEKVVGSSIMSDLKEPLINPSESDSEQNGSSKQKGKNNI